MYHMQPPGLARGELRPRPIHPYYFADFFYGVMFSNGKTQVFVRFIIEINLGVIAEWFKCSVTLSFTKKMTYVGNPLQMDPFWDKVGMLSKAQTI